MIFQSHMLDCSTNLILKLKDVRRNKKEEAFTKCVLASPLPPVLVITGNED